MWKCIKCNREFKKENQTHSCVIFQIENHFKGKEELGKKLFYEFVDKIEDYIGKVKVESLPCCIHLVSSYTFCGVWILKDKIRFDIRLDRKIKNSKVTKEYQISKNRTMYHFELANIDDLDDDLLGFIKEAYFLN